MIVIGILAFPVKQEQAAVMVEGNVAVAPAAVWFINKAAGEIPGGFIGADGTVRNPCLIGKHEDLLSGFFKSHI